MQISKQLADKVTRQREAGLLRTRSSFIEESENQITFADGQRALNFSSNDYLGIASDRALRKEIAESAESYGFGSGSSALICGYQKVHQECEQAYADFVGRDRAILVGSGFLANVGIFSALTEGLDGSVRILLDRLAHASLIDGVRQSGTRFQRFKHNSAEELAGLTERYSADPLLVATETVFSMDGDIANLPPLVSVCGNNATLVVDDAHGIGVLGEQGRGGLSHFGLTQNDVPVLITPLGKAVGSYGAFISGSNSLIEAIEQFSRSYIYSTALPPIQAFATLKLLQYLQQEEWRREKLSVNIEHANREILRLGLQLVSDDPTPIRAILIGDNDVAIKVRDQLLKEGYLISAIRPPTVPKGTARVRFSLNSLHSTAQITAVLERMAALIADFRKEAAA